SRCCMNSGQMLKTCRFYRLKNVMYYVRYPNFGENGSRQVLEQIDGVICCNRLYAIVEFKDYTSDSISVEPLAKMRNMLARRHGNVFGMFFSSTPFTTPAQIQVQFMAPQIIILWGFEDMDYCMRNECFIDCMEWKYQQAIERCEYNLNYKQEKSQYPICEPLF
ncbi:MAG: restriction endonuclease, partial [Muribaculaceae bacterium]|nr:restriction endonuclease [Muribaculaceae bacterium]